MTTRRLAAILAADVVGFSALMGRDEEGTLDRIKWLRREVIDPKVRAHHGRVFKATGDGLLVEFPSPVEAVRCAAEVQDVLASEAAQESSQALQLRIGINLGDIIIEEDGDVFGEGVNIAARLEQLAILVAFVSPGRSTRRCEISSHTHSRTWASSTSRTSRIPCASMRSEEAGCGIKATGSRS